MYVVDVFRKNVTIFVLQWYRWKKLAKRYRKKDKELQRESAPTGKKKQYLQIIFPDCKAERNCPSPIKSTYLLVILKYDEFRTFRQGKMAVV